MIVVVIVVWVSFARIHFGVHYLTDCLAGALLVNLFLTKLIKNSRV